MITRKEIEQLIQSQNIGYVVDNVWDINYTLVPQLLTGGHEGDDCRFGLAEHMIHKHFSMQAAKDAPDSAFSTFCQQFRASEKDIATALISALKTSDSENITASDIASSLIWLWFIDASKEYGIYDVELKFFLYAIADLSRGDEETKRAGMKNLTHEIASDPFQMIQLLSRIRDRFAGTKTTC